MTILGAELQMFSNRILTRPITTCHSLADHSDWQRSLGILYGEQPSFQQRDPQSREKIWADHLSNGRRHFAGSGRRCAFGFIFGPIPIPTGWNAGNASCRFHRWKRPQVSYYAVIVSENLVIVLILHLWQSDTEGEHAGAVESHFSVHELTEPLHHQPRSN